MIKPIGQAKDGVVMLALLVAIGVVSASWFGAWLVGITPASQQEREFIQMAMKSSFAKKPSVQAAIKVSNNTIYLSRRHFCAVADAVTGFQNC